MARYQLLRDYWDGSRIHRRGAVVEIEGPVGKAFKPLDPPPAEPEKEPDRKGRKVEGAAGVGGEAAAAGGGATA